MARPTSAETLRQITEEGLLSESRLIVYKAASEWPEEHFTACELAHLVLGSRRDVSSRCSELVRYGVFREAGVRECQITGRKVLSFAVTDELPSVIEKAEALTWGDALDLVEFETVRFALARALESEGVKPAAALRFLTALEAHGLTVATKPAEFSDGQAEMFGA